MIALCALAPPLAATPPLSGRVPEEGAGAFEAALMAEVVVEGAIPAENDEVATLPERAEPERTEIASEAEPSTDAAVLLPEILSVPEPPPDFGLAPALPPAIPMEEPAPAPAPAAGEGRAGRFAALFTIPPAPSALPPLRDAAPAPPPAVQDAPPAAAIPAHPAVTPAPAPPDPSFHPSPEAPQVQADPPRIEAAPLPPASPAPPAAPAASQIHAPVPPAALGRVAARLAPEHAPGTVELRLSPEELGRVTISFALEGGALRVAVMAERAETMDLLRRHAGEFLADLRDNGFNGASLSFGGGGAQGREPRPDGPPAAEPPPAVVFAPAPPPRVAAGGLYLRL